MADAPAHLRLAIVEDEPLARRALVNAVRTIDWITIVGEAADGPSATELLTRTKPDVALMDINLPGQNALTVLERLAEPPAVIFVTAHDRHAAAAFDLAAIDYVLKPYSPARLLLALERSRDAVQGRSPANAARNLPTSTERARRALDTDTAIETLFVRDRGAIVAIPVSEVVRFEADDVYVAIIARGRRFLVQMALADVERRLAKGMFLRIHRCHLVNLAQVSAFTPTDGGRFEAVLRDGSRAPVSRRHAKEVRSLALR